jgi:O-glycosyl hydrolase
MATAKWVKIHGFGGFTGSAWEGGIGHTTATVAGSTYTIAEDAYGYGLKNPNKPKLQDRRILLTKPLRH